MTSEKLEKHIPVSSVLGFSKPEKKKPRKRKTEMLDASRDVGRTLPYTFGFPTNVLGIPKFQNGKIQEKKERLKNYL